MGTPLADQASQRRQSVSRLPRPRAAAFILALAASAAACTTGSVLSLQPAVDVGPTTASIARIEPPSAIPQAELAPASVPFEQARAPQPSESVLVEPTPEVFAAPQAETLSPSPPVQTASLASRQGVGLQTLVPSDPYMTGYPRIDPPVAPKFNPMPAEEIDCRAALKRLKVNYVDLAPIRDGQCGIDYPVKVSSMGNVRMKPAATLTCAMALTFSEWTAKELVPSARRRYFSGVKTIHQGSSYSCRKIARSRTLSEHGKGNALDIMSIELNNGKEIDVRKPGFFAFRQKGFLNTVRADGCQYFNTVLGPGYNYDHRNHFHFDIKQRRNSRVACH
jgi:hypothetical protein